MRIRLAMIDPWTWWRTSGVLVAFVPRGAGRPPGAVVRSCDCGHVQESPCGGLGSGLCYWVHAERIVLAHPAILHAEVALFKVGVTMTICLEALGVGYFFVDLMRNWT